MTTEFVLLLSVWAFIVLGIFLGDSGPIRTFERSSPRLAARVERNISVGQNFFNRIRGQNVTWTKPGG